MRLEELVEQLTKERDEWKKAAEFNSLVLTEVRAENDRLKAVMATRCSSYEEKRQLAADRYLGK